MAPAGKGIWICRRTESLALYKGRVPRVLCPAIAASCLCCAKLGSGNGNRIIKIIPKFARSRRFPLRPKSTGKRCPLTDSYPLGIRVRLVGQGFASVENSRPRITIIIQGQLIELITERRSKVYVAGGRLCSSFRQKVTTGAHGNRGITGLPFALEFSPWGGRHAVGLSFRT